MVPKKATASTGATKKAAGHASYRGMFLLILLHHHIASQWFWYRYGREYLLIHFI